MFGLTLLITAWSASAEIVISGPWQQPEWITNALEAGTLDQKTVDLMRQEVICQPSACPVTWVRAVHWLERNAVSIQKMPEITNGAGKFTSVVGELKNFPGVTISIRMITSRPNVVASVIHIEDFSFFKDDGPAIPKYIRDAKIFADFKSYMLSSSGGSK